MWTCQHMRNALLWFGLHSQHGREWLRQPYHCQPHRASEWASTRLHRSQSRLGSQSFLGTQHTRTML